MANKEPPQGKWTPAQIRDFNRQKQATRIEGTVQEGDGHKNRLRDGRIRKTPKK